MKYETMQVSWLGHASFKLKGSKTIYTDPFKIGDNAEKADIILISHDHFDHCSIEDIQKLIQPSTVIVTVPDCQSKLRSVVHHIADVKLVTPGVQVTIEGVHITAVPAYTLTKFRPTGEACHPQEYEWVGYMVVLDGVKVYHAGDTDNIPEMAGLKPDIALLPVSGTYVMDPGEAAQAAIKIQPKIAIPMHYGSIVGTEADAQNFKRLLDGKVHVEILQKE